MENRDGYYPEPLYAALLSEYTATIRRIEQAVDVRLGVQMTPDWYREQLDQGRLLIVQCIVPGNADGMHEETLHWLLVYKYDEAGFWACDPMACKIPLTEEEMNHYTDTPIGKVCVAVDGEAMPVAPGWA